MPSTANFSTHFDHLDDPRRAQGKLHRLGDILTIALCGVLAGAEGWEDLGTYARFKADWLSERLDLKHGVPGSDTFRRVISRLDPEAFARGFMRWIRGGIAEKIEGEVVAIDGKTVRRSYEEGDPKAALHMLSAWASEQRLVLAQQKVGGKTNEIGVLPDLLEAIDLQGCTVTLDAMGTQRHVAAKIIEQGGDYALALKANQKKLYREVREYFEEGFERSFEGMPVACADTTDIGHGRKEVRRLWVSSDVEWLPKVEDWPQVSSIALIEHERDTYEDKSTQRRFFISSLSCEAEKLMGVIRSHWGIENSVHWILDVVFREDESRIRRDHGGENMKVLRHAALNLLRQNGEEDMSLRMKRKRAGWDDSFVDDLVDF